jgi:hypothetical protein
VFAKQVLYHLSHTSSALVILEMGVHELLICLDWPQTLVLWILAFQVARITGVSHQYLENMFLKKLL